MIVISAEWVSAGANDHMLSSIARMALVLGHGLVDAQRAECYTLVYLHAGLSLWFHRSRCPYRGRYKNKAYFRGRVDVDTGLAYAKFRDHPG